MNPAVQKEKSTASIALLTGMYLARCILGRTSRGDKSADSELLNVKKVVAHVPHFSTGYQANPVHDFHQLNERSWKP